MAIGHEDCAMAFLRQLVIFGDEVGVDVNTFALQPGKAAYAQGIAPDNGLYAAAGNFNECTGLYELQAALAGCFVDGPA